MKHGKKLLTALMVLVFFSLLPLAASGETERYELPIDNAVYRGPADAPITIIEFLDFQ